MPGARTRPTVLCALAVNVAIGYAAIDGDKALAGTGALCAHPQQPGCNPNSDPAAILPGGKPFG